ncbi:MAG: SAM-dependent methyltransferase [Bacteroidetes bacterium]|nr:MAG: SAM-dependent methyltransferase [Bacteroidota bacterium]
MSQNNIISYSLGKDDKTAVQAKFEAQKIAFAPIMFQATRSLLNLGILKHIQNNRKKGSVLEEIALQLDIDIYGVKVLLEAGLSMEIVYVKEGRFFITKTGWFLLNDPLTKVNLDFTNDVNYLGFAKLEESIKTGKPEGLKVFGEWSTVYEALSELPEKTQESWFNFDHYYSDIAFPEVLPIIMEDKPKNGMDVGGNTGKFAMKCAEYNDDIHMTILDLPGQLNVAKKNIKNNGFENQIDGYPMDLLDHTKAFPKGYDFVWMSQFLDCFSQADILQLILRAKAALSENGALYILETYWDKQDYEAATYSLHATSLYFTCMANGCSQMYHHNDMLKLIDEAGMKIDKEYERIGISHTLYKCVPK